MHDKPQEDVTVVQAAAAMLMWRNLTVKKAFCAWLECMHTTQAHHGLAEAALLRLMHSLEAAVFAAWREHASWKAQFRARLQEVVHAMQHQASLGASLCDLSALQG